MKSAPKTSEASAELEQLYHSLIQVLEDQANPDVADRARYTHKYEGYVSYGIKSPALKKTISQFRKSFRQLPLSERFSLAEKLFQSAIEEQALVANQLLALSTNSLLPTHLDYLDLFLDHFHSWSVTDDFCINVIQPLLQKHKAAVLQLLEKWNHSENRWKRRASMVAFVRKIGASGEFTDDVLRLCEALLWDSDDLVQKAVGWALKDNLRGAKDKILDYVKDLRRRGVSSTITLYAIRDLKGKERQTVLGIHARQPREGK